MFRESFIGAASSVYSSLHVHQILLSVSTADDDGQSIQLEILNLKSGETRALTQDQHLYLDPVISPDGTQLAYVSTQPKGYFNVYVRPLRHGNWDGPEIALTQDRQCGRD